MLERQELERTIVRRRELAHQQHPLAKVIPSNVWNSEFFKPTSDGITQLEFVTGPYFTLVPALATIMGTNYSEETKCQFIKGVITQRAKRVSKPPGEDRYLQSALLTMACSHAFEAQAFYAIATEELKISPEQFLEVALYLGNTKYIQYYYDRNNQVPVLNKSHIDLLVSLGHVGALKHFQAPLVSGVSTSLFNLAATNGQVEVLQYLQELSKDILPVAETFRVAVEGGHLDAVKYLANLLPRETRLSSLNLTQGISITDHLAHSHEFIDYLFLNYPEFLAIVDSMPEYQPLVARFINNILPELTTRQEEKRENAPEPVGVTLYLCILRHLIRRNDKNCFDAIKTLLNTVKESAHFAIAKDEPNELLRLALRINNEPVIGFFKEQVSGAWNLAAEKGLYAEELGARKFTEESKPSELVQLMARVKVLEGEQSKLMELKNQVVALESVIQESKHNYTPSSLPGYKQDELISLIDKYTKNPKLTSALNAILIQSNQLAKDGYPQAAEAAKTLHDSIRAAYLTYCDNENKDGFQLSFDAAVQAARDSTLKDHRGNCLKNLLGYASLALLAVLSIATVGVAYVVAKEIRYAITGDRFFPTNCKTRSINLVEDLNDSAKSLLGNGR